MWKMSVEMRMLEMLVNLAEPCRRGERIGAGQHEEAAHEAWSLPPQPLNCGTGILSRNRNRPTAGFVQRRSGGSARTVWS